MLEPKSKWDLVGYSYPMEAADRVNRSEMSGEKSSSCTYYRYTKTERQTKMRFQLFSYLLYLKISISIYCDFQYRIEPILLVIRR